MLRKVIIGLSLADIIFVQVSFRLIHNCIICVSIRISEIVKVISNAIHIEKFLLLVKSLMCDVLFRY